jgi:hypothetical protein
MIVYRLGVAHRGPSVEELLPGTAALVEHQRGILFGRAGVAMFRWFDSARRSAGWNDGRSRTCPCTPPGRRWWSFCFRRCSDFSDVHGRT